MTKVLIATPLFPPDIGGPATYSKILANELPKRGIGVDVLSFGSVRWLPKVVRHLFYFCKVFWRARKSDIIFAQDPVSVGFPSAIAASILRKPLILKVVGDYAWEQGAQRFGVKDLLDEFLSASGEKKYDFRVEFLRRIERFVAKRARDIVVPSQYLKLVVERWGINSEKIKVIYNSVSVPENLPSKEDSRKELGLSGKILVSVGRPVPWKGFEMLRELMPEIRKKYPDAQLFIISSKSRGEVLKYLRAADIFLLNTGYEGFSHQILEAMAVGTPIISTYAGGNKEVLRDRQNALVAGYNYKNAWTSAIFELLDNPIAQNLAENAKYDVQKFTGQNMIEETINILKQYA